VNEKRQKNLHPAAARSENSGTGLFERHAWLWIDCSAAFYIALLHRADGSEGR
jgi:hypothetical protein